MSYETVIANYESGFLNFYLNYMVLNVYDFL